MPRPQFTNKWKHLCSDPQFQRHSVAGQPGLYDDQFVDGLQQLYRKVDAHVQKQIAGSDTSVPHVGQASLRGGDEQVQQLLKSQVCVWGPLDLDASPASCDPPLHVHWTDTHGACVCNAGVRATRWRLVRDTDVAAQGAWDVGVTGSGGCTGPVNPRPGRCAGHGLPLSKAGGGGMQPGLLRLTHPPTHIRKCFLRKNEILSKGPEIGGRF